MRPGFIIVSLLVLSACGGGGGNRPEARPGPVGGTRSDPRLIGQAAPGAFRVKPYLQIGPAPAGDRLALLWQADDGLDGWSVEVRPDPASPWTPMPPPTQVRLAPADPACAPHRIWTAALGPLAPGATFQYRVLAHGREVFSPTEGRALRGPGQPQKVVVVGDLAEGTGSSLAVARQIQAQAPDLMVAVGDLAYQNGTPRDYHARFFPAYNGDPGEPGAGAPFMRGTPMVGVLGNHDVAHVGRNQVPHRDSLAYFCYWDQPRTGPDLAAGGHLPRLAPAGNWAGFRAAAGDRFPAMANFTFRSGDVHWTILDSNRYLDWSRPDLRAWLEAQLAAAQDATWRFVAFHHPAFNVTTFNHTNDWHMRELWPLFQRYRVDLVFCGHVHTYNRTRPVAFGPAPAGVSDAEHSAREANIRTDTDFDGRVITRARYPIQILTGAGGGTLYHPRLPDPPRPYMAAAVDRHSFSLLEIRDRRVEFRQMDAEGRVVDAFTLAK